MANKTFTVDNTGEADYAVKVSEVATTLKNWTGPIVIVSHTDPDGDALGSTLALKRALDTLGKDTQLPFNVPAYLSFLIKDGEISAPLDTLPENCLLAVLDVDIGSRAEGAPMTGAALTVNIDHHGSNARTANVSLVEPGKAATAQMVKDVIDALDIPWTSELATPCLTGILTDTGNFRYTNTNKEVLKSAAFLIDQGVDYGFLTDRLQWRAKSYFKMLGEVMGTVEYPLDGLVALAYVTLEMEQRAGKSDEDSNDFVGLIRYAEGVKVAIFLKERDGATKLSVRTRDGVSAQAICLPLSGGGHVAAAGAKVDGDVAEAKRRVLESTETELKRHGLI